MILLTYIYCMKHIFLSNESKRLIPRKTIKSHKYLNYQKLFCYESVYEEDPSQLIVGYSGYGQPPGYMRMDYLIGKHNGKSYYKTVLPKGIIKLYKRFDKDCNSTLQISGKGEIDTFFTFYSGNDGGHFFSFRFKFGEDAKDSRYNITGGRKFLSLAVDLVRDGEKPQFSDPNTRFNEKHISGNSLTQLTMKLCLSDGRRDHYIWVNYSDDHKLYFENIQSAKFFCGVGDEDEGQFIKLSAWTCNFSNDSSHPQVSSLVYYQSCSKESLRVKTVNINGQEKIFSFSIAKASVSVEKVDSIVIGNLTLQTWEKYEPTKIVNDHLKIFMMESNQKDGECRISDIQKQGHIIKIWGEDTEECDQPVFLWYEDPQSDGPNTSYVDFEIENENQCTFN